MDWDTIAKVMLILTVAPIVILLWVCGFAFIDDCFCDGEIRCKIKHWFRKNMGADND